ncbi:uncharacterized protein LOC143460723 [Clavelina lepadiformis]|uniref:uncharacterized protein LOC143460723 n=1 Tax=Clavelina lepadiformis TaxID=159417 RepID=UPI004041D9EB
MSQNPNVNFQGSTMNNAKVVGSQGVNYTEQNESGIRLDNEGTMNMRDVIRGNSGGVNINQTTINQQPQPSTSQASQPQSSDRKNHSKSISKQRTSAGNIVTNFFHGVFPFFILSNLEKTLKKHARVVCGEIIHPIKLDFAINTVDLELSQRVPQMPSDDEGHYNKRDEVVKAWESVKGNIELKDLFTLAKNFAEKEAERFGNVEAKQDYINKNKNTVVLIGQAGMGKTTLAKTIINLVTERQLLPACKFLFYIPFRAVDFLIESNFLDFVLRCFQSKWPHNIELDFVLLKKLSNDPNVLFIFDGLDEADTDYFFSNNTLSTCDLYDNYTPDIFIANILSGNIFANAKKLLTSRPRQFFELDKAYLSGFVVNILGLSVKSQAKLCKQLCKEKYDAVQNYLSRNPLIDASCFVPAKCIIIYGVLTDSFNSSLDHDIQSLTDIFVRALYYYSKSEEHVRKPEELQKLCHLAWNGFQARKIIFTESDISNVKISSETLETFLTTSTKIDNLQVNLLQGKKQSSFSHLIWRELFTAIHLILHVPSGEFQNHLSCFLESRWEVVALFVFGLCNRHVQTKLNDIFNIAVVDVDMKFQQLDNFVSTAMENLRESFQTSTFIEICNWIYQLNNRKLTEKVAAFVPEQILLDGRVHLTDLCSLDYLLQYAQSDFSIRFGESLSFTYNAIYRWFFQVSNKSNEVFCQNLIREIIKSAARQPDSSADNLLHACRWLYDKSEDSNAKEMVQYFPQLVLLTKPPSFDQITHLMYLIIQSTSSFKVHIKCNSPTIQIDGSLDPDEVITLVAFLHLVQEPWQLQMNEKKITSPTKVEHLLQVMMDTINKNSRRKVEIKFSPEEQAVDCNLSGCGISSQGTQTLAFFLLRLPYRINRLNLSENKFGDAGVQFIMSCLDKIEKLYMTDCNITEEGVRVMMEHIKNCSNLPKVLDFNYDKMNRWNVLCCGLDLLDNNGDFSNLDLTPVGVKALATAINKLPQPIDRLNLSGNKFGDAGVPFIMSCLDKIEKLYMTDCNITGEGVRVLTEHIKNCSNLPKVLEFNYDKMNLSNVLRCGLDQLGNGNCSNLGLTPVGVEALAAAINKLPQPMKKLYLWGNNLGDDGASHISTCLSKIEELHIRWCKISASGIKSISDAISKLPEPMKKLSLWGNNLGDDGASHISTCLNKIEELDIGKCNIRASGIKSISDAISKLPEPMKKLSLWGNNLGDDGASHISTCLNKIEELHIGECKISASGIKSISDAISKLPEPIDRLNLSGNKFGDAGVPFIMSCLDKIEKLYMTDCNITGEGVRVLTEHIENSSNLPKVLEFNYDKMNRSKVLRCGLDLLDNGNCSNLGLTPVGVETLAAAINKLPQPMKKLSLWGNDLGDDGASHISTCLSKIEELHIGECKISASGIKSISDAISKLPEPMKKLNLRYSNLGDDGASHISTCLSKIEELDISWCTISASGIKSISDAISKLPEPMKKLNLRYNNLGDDGASHILTCLSKIEKLHIGECKISASGIKSISDAISELPEPMKKLNISGNNLGDDGASHISTCLSNIEVLDIGECKISASGIKSISDAISKLPEPMKKLSLWGNNLGDDGASHISTCLNKIEELDIGRCKISASGIKSISDAISKLPEPIDRLNLSGNKFGDAGVPFIMSCLDKIEKLYMTDCNITGEGVRVLTEHIENSSNLPKVLEFNYDKMNRSKVLRCGLDLLDNGNFSHLGLTPVGVETLAAAINKLPQPMKRLHISFNNLGDIGASHISTCLSKIEELDIGWCEIRASEIKSISDAISKLPEPMKRLHISFNNLGDIGASHISTCLSKIEVLNIRECNISASGIKSISDAISKLPEPMKKLNLWGNNLDDEGAFHISTCLSKIEELNIGQCNISAYGIKSISDAISKLPEPIDRLNLSGNKFGDAGVPFIMSCLDKIEKLYMTDCNITGEGVRVLTEHIENSSNLPKVLEFNYDKMNRSKVLRCGLDLLDNGNFSHLGLTPVGVETLAAAINKLPQPMKKLNLSFNNLGDDGASHISTCLSKIEELNIGRCNISATGIKSISDAISKLPEPMKKLYLWGNDLGDDGASHISTCLSKIEELNIGRCNISATGIKSISDAISKLPEPMKQLVLYGNNLGDDGASHISTCLSKIEELDISWCKIRASGIKSISDAISKLPEPMKNLYLWGNNLCDDGASHISTCLSKIEKLHIGRCNISASGIKSISDAISKLPEPVSM